MLFEIVPLGIRSSVNRSSVVTLSVILVLITVAANCASWPQKNPRATLVAYIEAVEQNQPIKAYALLDEKLHQQMSEAQFQARFREVYAELKHQAQQLKAAINEPLRGHAELSYEPDIRVQLRWTGDAWVIENGWVFPLALSAPKEAILALIAAIELKDVEALLGLLAKDTRELLERELKNRVEELKSALEQPLEPLGDRIRLKLGVDGFIQLRFEEGQWKISDFK